MSVPVAVSSFALWTPTGVWINAVPEPGPGMAVAPWANAPALSQVHPRARRIEPQAVALVQLAHALLSARNGRGLDSAPAPSRHKIDLMLGTVSGSAAADLEFLDGTQSRGAPFGSPSTFVYTLPTSAPAEVALASGLRGALSTVTAGTVSGLASVARAAADIAAGRSSACICGGVEFTHSGNRRAGGTSEQDVLALFLLEAGEPPTPWPRLLEWEVGFEPGTLPHGIQACTALAGLTALARAMSAPPGSDVQEVSGSSAEGHWAKLRVAACPSTGV